MPRRSVVALAAVAVACLLASCGATDIPSPRRTVVVTVDAPATSSAAPTPAPSTAVPTTSATSTPVPTALAVGKQRGAPKSFAEAKSRIDAAKPSSVGAAFRSPTGNIVCRGAGAAVACEVLQGRTRPPVPSLCPPGGATDIGRIELGPAGARPVCNTDTIRTGSEPALAYGSRAQPSGTTACLSETTGMTCIDAAGRHGFFLARNTFVTF